MASYKALQCIEQGGHVPGIYILKKKNASVNAEK